MIFKAYLKILFFENENLELVVLQSVVSTILIFEQEKEQDITLSVLLRKTNNVPIRNLSQNP